MSALGSGDLLVFVMIENVSGGGSQGPIRKTLGVTALLLRWGMSVAAGEPCPREGHL